MAMVKTIEKRIFKVEHFHARVLWEDGRDLRSDRRGFPQYRFTRAAKNTMTVEGWKATRYRPWYPGFHVEVLDPNGYPVPGNMKLATLRRAYSNRDV